MSLKQKIFDVLETIDVPSFYGMSTQNTFPFVRYTLGNHYSKRLSDEKAIKNIWYQIDVYSTVPIDVEDTDGLLKEIETKLEAERLFTDDWKETIDIDNQSTYPIYHYFIEVRS